MMRAALVGVEGFARSLERRARAIDRETKKAALQAADRVVETAEGRVRSRQRVTIQDNSSEIRPRPPRIGKAQAGGGVSVTMGGQWGHARSDVVSRVMSLEGYAGLLIRKHLWVKRNEGFQEKLLFSQTPWLRQWGEREDRGRQRYRHAVRLPPEVRMRLTLSPALMENQDHSVELFRTAFLRGLT